MPLTLAQMALAASQDPNNPAYNPAAINAQYGTSSPPPVVPAPPAPGAPYDPAAINAQYGTTSPTNTLTGPNNLVLPPSLTNPNTIIPYNPDPTSTLPPKGKTPPTNPYGTAATPIGAANAAATGAAVGGAAGATATTGAGQTDPRLTALSQGDVNDQQYRQSLQDQQDSIDKQTQILTSGAQQAKDLTTKRQVDDFVNQADLQNFQRQATSDANLRQIELDRQAALLRDAHPDPNKWFKDRGVAGSILAAVAMGAGAFAAAMPHGENHQNQAMDVINKSIDRDVQAQRDDIDDRWKSLSFQGSEDQKKYARDQFQMAQMRDSRLLDWNHASAMIDQQIAQTNDSAKVAGLQGLKTQVQGQIQALNAGSIQHRADVLTRIRAEQIASANQGKFTVKEIATNAFKLYQDPNFQPPAGMSREEAALRAAGGSMTGNGNSGATVTKAGTGITPEGKKALGNIGEQGSNIAGVSGPGRFFNSVISKLPGSTYFAPGASMAENDRQDWNHNVITTLQRLAGDRVPPQVLQKAIEDSQISATESSASASHKIDRFKSNLSNFLAMPAKNKGAAAEEP